MPSTSIENLIADHWLYHLIPHHRKELTLRQPWKYITWALVGNDDDGIFGEGPKSGTKWHTKWQDTVVTVEGIKKVAELGEISFKRFLSWQLRNPLHNFTFYFIGFAAKKNIPLIQLALISTKGVSFYRRLTREEGPAKVSLFPMKENSGIYLGIHALPCVSFRLNLWNWKCLEGYAGWRTRGNFGLACRLKLFEHLK